MRGGVELARLCAAPHATPRDSANGTLRPVLSSLVAVMNAPGGVPGLACHLACMPFSGPCGS
jgi:hypothetical protein